MKRIFNFVFAATAFIYASNIFGQKVIIANDRPLMYRGYPNIMNIAVDGYSQKQIKGLIVDGGRWRRMEDKFIVIPDSVHFSIKVKLLTKNGRILITEPGEYFSRKLPAPPAFLGSASDQETISRGELLITAYICAGFGDGFAPAWVHYHIKKASIAVIGPGIVCFDTLNSVIPLKIRHSFSLLQPGTCMYLNNIKTVIAETGYSIDAHPARIRLRPVTNNGYILRGCLKTGSKDSFFSLNTTSLHEEEILKITTGSKSGKWTLHPVGCDSARIISGFEFKDNQLVETLNYNDSGQLKSKTTFGSINKRTEFAPNGNAELMYQYLPVDNYRLVTYVQNARNETYWNNYFTSAGFDTVRQCLFGTWCEYYPNGSIKTIGNFDTLTIQNSDTSYISDPDDPYNIQGLGVFHSLSCFQSGTWTYYAPNGKIEKQVLFIKGKRQD